jgi:hypothetical protein
VTDHAASDAAGTAILGEQERPFWDDHLEILSGNHDRRVAQAPLGRIPQERWGSGATRLKRCRPAQRARVGQQPLELASSPGPAPRDRARRWVTPRDSRADLCVHLCVHLDALGLIQSQIRRES